MVGASEGQLGRVEEHLRGVEVRTRMVEKGISGLEERILLVEEQVQKCCEDEERKYHLQECERKLKNFSTGQIKRSAHMRSLTSSTLKSSEPAKME